MKLLLAFIAVAGIHSGILASQWQQRADFGNFGRHRATGMAIGNKVYAGTGHLNGTGTDTWYPDWWEYDPATNSWTQKADYPGNNGNGDQDVASFAIDNVGFAGLGQIDGNSFFKYDPQVNQWTQVSSPPASYSFNNTFPFRIGNKGYFPTLYSNVFFEYDPANDTWTQLGNLPFNTMYGIPTFSIGDKGYIKNGTAFYEYKPSTDSWTQKATFPGMYPHRPRGISQYGYGYFIGGFQGSPSALPWIWGNEIWRYDPVNDAWTQLEDFPGTTRRWAVLVRVDDRVYYGLGTNGTNFNDFWEFNSIAETQEFDANQLNVYPSPATDHVNFTLPDNELFEIHIYDLKGNHVRTLKSENGKAVLNRENLPKGNYIYHLRKNENNLHSGRFVFI